METKANYVLIGMFTLAVIAGVFGFVYWFQNVGGTRERVPYRIVFQGSVAGLHTGANVLLNGIQVGDVTSLKLDPQRPKEVAALVNIDKSVQIHSDVEVGLEFQGLTGVAQIALKGGSPDSPILQSSKEKPALLTAPPAATLDFTQAARDTLRRLDDFVAANQDIIKDALKNIDTFTAALARNSDRLDKIVAGVQDLTGGDDGKGGKLNEAAKSIRTLSDNLDQRTADISVNLNRLLVNGNKHIEVVGNDLHRTLGTIDTAVKNFDKNPSRLIFGGSGSK